MPRTRPVEDIEAETVGRNADPAGHEPERPEPPDPTPHKTCSDGKSTRASLKNEVG